MAAGSVGFDLDGHADGAAPRFAPKGWGAVLALSRATYLDINNTNYKQVSSMACPGATTYMYKNYLSSGLVHLMTKDLPERKDILACLKDHGNMHNRIQSLMDLRELGKPQFNYGDLFLSHIAAVLGDHVSVIPYDLALMMTKPDPSTDDPGSHQYKHLRDASIIVTFLSSEQGTDYVPGSGEHFSPLIILWEEKQLLFIEPHGNPDRADYYLKDNVMNGIRVMIAWLSLIKQIGIGDKGAALAYAQGFQLAVVGLPKQYRQDGGTNTCMCVSCGVSMLFLKYFDSQYKLGIRPLVFPNIRDRPDHYDFDKVCGGERTEMTDKDVASFQSGIMRLALETMECQEMAEDIGRNLGRHEEFLKLPHYGRLEGVRNYFTVKRFEGGLVSDPGTPLEILEKVRQIHAVTSDKGDWRDEWSDQYSTSKLMLLLMATLVADLTPTRKIIRDTHALRMIFNATVDDKPSTATLGACPPVPFKTIAMGTITEEHFVGRDVPAPSPDAGRDGTVSVPDSDSESGEGEEGETSAATAASGGGVEAGEARGGEATATADGSGGGGGVEAGDATATGGGGGAT